MLARWFYTSLPPWPLSIAVVIAVTVSQLVSFGVVPHLQRAATEIILSSAFFLFVSLRAWDQAPIPGHEIAVHLAEASAYCMFRWTVHSAMIRKASLSVFVKALIEYVFLVAMIFLSAYLVQL